MFFVKDQHYSLTFTISGYSSSGTIEVEPCSHCGVFPVRILRAYVADSTEVACIGCFNIEVINPASAIFTPEDKFPLYIDYTFNYCD